MGRAFSSVRGDALAAPCRSGVRGDWSAAGRGDSKALVGRGDSKALERRGDWRVAGRGDSKALVGRGEGVAAGTLSGRWRGDLV